MNNNGRQRPDQDPVVKTQSADPDPVKMRPNEQHCFIHTFALLYLW